MAVEATWDVVAENGKVTATMWHGCVGHEAPAGLHCRVISASGTQLWTLSQYYTQHKDADSYTKTPGETNVYSDGEGWQHADARQRRNTEQPLHAM